MFNLDQKRFSWDQLIARTWKVVNRQIDGSIQWCAVYCDCRPYSSSSQRVITAALLIPFTQFPHRFRPWYRVRGTGVFSSSGSSLVQRSTATVQFIGPILYSCWRIPPVQFACHSEPAVTTLTPTQALHFSLEVVSASYCRRGPVWGAGRSNEPCVCTFDIDLS